MDYLSRAAMIEHADWPVFAAWRLESRRRLIALSTRGGERLDDFRFRADDILLLGRESAGLPSAVLEAADGVLRIPILKANRSLNVASAASIATFEALRQTGQLAPQ